MSRTGTDSGLPGGIYAAAPIVLDARSWPDAFGPLHWRWVLLTARREFIDVNLVMWPGDGTGSLWAGSWSLMNFRMPTGELALAVDVPRVGRDGERYWPATGTAFEVTGGELQEFTVPSGRYGAVKGTTR
jgi:hypothetical protein